MANADLKPSKPVLERFTVVSSVRQPRPIRTEIDIYLPPRLTSRAGDPSCRPVARTGWICHRWPGKYSNRGWQADHHARRSNLPLASLAKMGSLTVCCGLIQVSEKAGWLSMSPFVDCFASLAIWTERECRFPTAPTARGLGHQRSIALGFLNKALCLKMDPGHHAHLAPNAMRCLPNPDPMPRRS